MTPLEEFLRVLRPLLEEHRAQAAYVFGSWARGCADAHSDIDVIIVAPSKRPFVDRFRDYLPAILAAPTGVDLFVYTPEEFQRMNAQENPFLTSALQGARLIYEEG